MQDEIELDPKVVEALAQTKAKKRQHKNRKRMKVNGRALKNGRQIGITALK